MLRRGVYSGTMRRKLEAHKGGGTDLIEMSDRQGRYYHDSHQMNEQIYGGQLNTNFEDWMH